MRWVNFPLGRLLPSIPAKGLLRAVLVEITRHDFPHYEDVNLLSLVGDL